MAEFAQSIAADGSAVVQVVGDIDLIEATNLLASGRLALSKSAAVELDLAGVTFIDSTGLAAMLHLLKEAEQQGASLTLSNLTGRTHRLLAATGLVSIFNIRVAQDSGASPD
jgi:anti-anti-sigma factor